MVDKDVRGWGSAYVESAISCEKVPSDGIGCLGQSVFTIVLRCMRSLNLCALLLS